MTDHTPTPWIEDCSGEILHEDDRGRVTFVVAGTIPFGIYVRNDADRDLILAAPDMYEALERVLDFTVSDELRMTVCDVLKKARGEQ